MQQFAKISFGKFIKEKRTLQGKSIRSFSEEIGISAAYLSDVENGNRYPPQKYLSVLIDKLGLSAEEMEIFYDLVGQESGNYIDINVYLKDNENVRKDRGRFSVLRKLVYTVQCSWQQGGTDRLYGQYNHIRLRQCKQIG